MMNKRKNIFIEIQENWLKAAWGVDTPSGFEIAACHVQSIEGLSDADIIKELARILGQLKIKLVNADIAVVFPRHMVVVRYLLLPSHTDVEIRQMVDLQIFKHIPYAKGEVVIDYQIILKESSGYSRVMVFAVERETALRLWNMCSAAGAWVSSMTVSSLGLLHWVSQVSPLSVAAAETEACLVVDHDGTELCICTSGKLIFSRSFRIGSKDLNAEGLGEWLQQIELSFKQYRSEQFLESPKRFLVIAQEPLSALIQESLKETYKIPVDMAADHLNIFASHGMTASDLVPYLVSVCGVALRGAKAAINLIPAEAKLAKSDKDRRGHLIKITALGILLVFAAFFALNVVNVKRNWYLAQLNGEIKKTQMRLKALQPKVQLIESVDKYLQERLILADILSELSRVLPPTTSLTMFSVNSGRNIVLQGMSQRASEVSLLQKGLLNSGKFGNVTLDYTNKTITVQGEVSVFQITCQLIKEKI